MKPLRPQKLRNQVLNELMENISGSSPGDNRLPSEEQLAQQLDVSRATVREALAELTNKGYITRRQGKGNFGHPSAMRLSHRLDLSGDFFQLLRTPQGPPPCEIVRTGYSPVPPQMREIFPDCRRAFEQFWLYGATAHPMILCKNYVPEDLLESPPQPPKKNQTMLDWILRYCNKDSAFYAVHMGCAANKEAAWVLGVPEDTVLLNWQETVFDINDEPVAYSDVYFHPENVNLSMVL